MSSPEASEVSITYARALVQARLGREPQDALEAAVVLEAWGGLRATSALALGHQLVALADGTEELPRSKEREERPRETGVVGEALTLVLTVVAVAAWAPALVRQLGAQSVASALWLALPLTLSLQWTLRSRYLGRTDGLGRLAQQRGSLVAGGLTLAGVLPLVLGVRGALASLLVITWVAGSVLARRGWGVGYGLVLLLVAVCLEAGFPALALVALAAALTLLAAWKALPPKASALRSPGPWAPAAAAGAMGAGLGVLFVGDSSADWGTNGALTALSLIPSTLASFWGGLYLRRLREVVPRALANVSVLHAGRISFDHSPLQVLTGALLRLAGASVALSAALLLFIPAAGFATVSPGLLVGFASVSLAVLTISLLESLGHTRLAVLAVVAALGGEFAVELSGGAAFSGAGLALGGALGALVALPLTVRLLLCPGRALATSLWIP